MRVYTARSRAIAKEILQRGFQDYDWKNVDWRKIALDSKLYTDEGVFIPTGVYVTSVPLAPAKEFGQGVIVSVEIPLPVFERYEELDTLLMQECGYRKALIPSDALNKVGKHLMIVEVGTGSRTPQK